MPTTFCSDEAYRRTSRLLGESTASTYSLDILTSHMTSDDATLFVRLWEKKQGPTIAILTRQGLAATLVTYARQRCHV